jgi:plasmid maintenance system killer protein
MNKTEWLNKQYEIFQNEQWDIIMELMREVYRVAKMDSDFDNHYT